MELHRLRENSLEALTKIDSKKIDQITISDGDLENVKNYLKEAGINNWNDYFFDLYPMVKGEQKDILNMLDYYKEVFEFKFNPKKVLVIGDNYDIDIALAKKQGCQTLHTPQKDKNKIRIPFPVDEIIEFL